MEISDLLVYKYADGNVYSDPSESAPGTATPLGYPSDYLEAVGYQMDRHPKISEEHAGYNCRSLAVTFS